MLYIDSLLLQHLLTQMHGKAALPSEWPLIKTRAGSRLVASYCACPHGRSKQVNLRTCFRRAKKFWEQCESAVSPSMPCAVTLIYLGLQNCFIPSSQKDSEGCEALLTLYFILLVFFFPVRKEDKVVPCQIFNIIILHTKTGPSLPPHSAH